MDRLVGDFELRQEHFSLSLVAKTKPKCWQSVCVCVLVRGLSCTVAAGCTSLWKRCCLCAIFCYAWCYMPSISSHQNPLSFLECSSAVLCLRSHELFISKRGGESEKLVERIIRMEGWDEKKGNPTKIPLPIQIVQSLSTFQSILFSPVLYPPLWSSDDVRPRARLV